MWMGDFEMETVVDWDHVIYIYIYILFFFFFLIYKAIILSKGSYRWEVRPSVNLLLSFKIAL